MKLEHFFNNMLETITEINIKLDEIRIKSKK